MTRKLLIPAITLPLAAIAAWVLWGPVGSRAGTTDWGSPAPPVATPVEGFILREVGPGSGVALGNVCGPPDVKNFIIEANGSGAALLDYDGDGDLDIYIVNGSSIAILRKKAEPVRNALYRNDGGWRFTDVTEEAGVGDEGWGCGCAVGDIDNDGDPDLYVANYGRNLLYRNEGGGKFREVTEETGVGDDGWGHSAAFGDIDNDGDLDLYVGNNLEFDIDRPPNEGKRGERIGLQVFVGPMGLTPQPDRLYENDGSGKFRDISSSSGIHSSEPRFGLGVVFGDYDDDGRVDIYVANDSVPNSLFHNLGGGKFEEVGGLTGTSLSGSGEAQAGMGVDCGDANGDGRIDIVVTNFSRDHNTLYESTAQGFFEDVSYRCGLGRSSWSQLGWATKLFDADNDGDLDLYVANGHIYPDVDGAGVGTTYRQADQLFLNSGEGEFVEVSDRIRVTGPVHSSRGAAFGDIDNDGDIDVVIVEMADRPTLLENLGGNRGNWITLVLRGRESNREGAGARIRLTALGKTQRKEATRSGSYCSSNDPRVHFGLGEAERVDEIEIRWPSGAVQKLTDIPANQFLPIDEQ